MRVLFVASTIAQDKNKVKSGFTYMVRDIADCISKDHDVFLFTPFLNNKCIPGCIKEKSILCFNPISIFEYFTRSIVELKHARLLPNPKKLKIIFSWINVSAFENAIIKIKADIIHIHGIDLYTNPIIQFCRKKRLKYIVTLHGLNANVPNIALYYKKIERDFLVSSSYYKDTITVVSTGVKNRISDIYHLHDNRHIEIIPNGIYMNRIKTDNSLLLKKMRLSD
jgi:hypothetical protein